MFMLSHPRELNNSGAAVASAKTRVRSFAARSRDYAGVPPILEIEDPYDFDQDATTAIVGQISAVDALGSRRLASNRDGSP